jgi:hypothetical protein
MRRTISLKDEERLQKPSAIAKPKKDVQHPKNALEVDVLKSDKIRTISKISQILISPI